MSKDAEEIKSRKQFVRHVVHTIERSFSDSNNKEAFIFGISGKWGEGKTTFLEDLESNFNQDVRVIGVNPWKFANDKISFLRAFLRELNSVIPYSDFYDKKYPKLEFARTAWRWLTKRYRNGKLKPLYDDFSRNRVDYKNLLIVFAFIIVASLVYGTLLSESLKGLIYQYRWFLTALLVPVAISVAESIVTTQRSYHSIATLDGFNDLVTEILKGFKQTRIVVFVDDLDRITGEKAIEVLDNLRTFFDKPEFAYIVAGDHVVLERHLGAQLLPSDHDLKVQKEEGRRFLKKIFNVYWRLPLPTKPELENFIDQDIMRKTSEIGVQLKEFIKTDDDRKRLSEQLATYFDNNYRNTLRFADRAVFTFQVIKSQIDNPDLEKSKKKYFREMLKNPLLVVRVLLLEELANPFYEKVLSRPSLFSNMEVETVKGNGPKIDLMIKSQNMILSDDQQLNLRRLLSDEPRFYTSRGLRVMSLIPYLYLSSDSSFGDERGLSPTDFIDCLKQDDYEELKAVIEQSGTAKAKAAANELIKVLKASEDGVAAGLMTTLFKGLERVAPDFQAHAIFQDKFDPEIVAATIEPLEEEAAKNDLFLAYTSWLNAIGSSIVSPAVFSKSLDDSDITALSKHETFTREASRVIAAWFVDNFSSDQSVLDALQVVIDALNTDAMDELIPLAKDALVNNFVLQSNEAYRALVLRLLKNHVNTDGIAALKEKAIELLTASNAPIWAIAETELVNGGVISQDEIDDILLNILKASTDNTDLKRGVIFVVDKLHSKEKLWTYLLSDRVDNISASFTSYVNMPQLLPIAPGPLQASLLFEAIYNKYKGDGEEHSILQYFRKEQWYFNNLEKIPSRVSVRNRTRASDLDPNIKTQLLHILDSEWPITD